MQLYGYLWLYVAIFDLASPHNTSSDNAYPTSDWCAAAARIATATPAAVICAAFAPTDGQSEAGARCLVFHGREVVHSSFSKPSTQLSLG